MKNKIFIRMIFTISLVLFFPGQVFSETSQDEKSITSYTTSITKIEKLLNDKSYSKLSSELRRANSIYKGMSDEAKNNSETKENYSKLSKLTVTIEEILEDNKRIKSDNSHLKKITGYLERANSSVEEGDNSKARSILKSALKYVNKISDKGKEIDKTRLVINEVNRLKAVVDLAVENSEREEYDTKKLTSAAEKIENFNRILGLGGSLIPLVHNMEEATEYYNAVSELGKKTPLGIDITAKYIEAMVSLGNFADEKEVSDKLNNEIFTERKGISSFRNNELFRILQKGKNGFPYEPRVMLDRDLEDLEFIKENDSTAKQMLTLLKNKFPASSSKIGSNKDLDYMIELLENYMVYRNTFIKIACDFLIEDMIEYTDGISKNLEDDGYITQFNYHNLFGDNRNIDYSIIATTKVFYDWAKQVAPQDRISLLQGYKAKGRKLFESQTKKNSFDDSKFRYTDKLIKEVGDAQVYDEDMKLVQISITDNNDWYIERDVWSTPIYKSVEGFAVYKKNGENFNRGYNVYLESRFDGVSYGDYIMIIKDSYFYPSN